MYDNDPFFWRSSDSKFVSRWAIGMFVVTLIVVSVTQLI